MQDFARAFYSSKAWQHCRAAYASSVHNLCERCLKEGRYTAGEIVHHKIRIDPLNIHDPTVTLNFDNLELLCRDCHAKEHGKKKRYTIDELGRVICGK